MFPTDIKLKLLACSFVLLFTSNSFAGWNWGIGYHNPPGSTLGVNFMYLWSAWALELGIGSIDGGTSNNNSSNDNSTLSIGGDINLKYLFGSGFFRPYLQGGMGLGTGLTIGDNTGAGAGTGGIFFGGGAFLMANPFHIYLGLITDGGDFGTQAGIGFPF